ncbi:hypothetical protein C8R46DRAFT_94932 [Mycena filopes]|nr:hypothetical protein C8R46DRAFT_94932 [Mycena filopes]
MDGSDPLRLLAHALQMAEKATGDADLRAKHQDRKIEVLRGEVARLASKCDKLENDLEESRKSLAEERRTSALRADAARAAEEYLRAHRQRAAEELARAAKTLHVLADRQNRLSLDFGRSSELVMTRKLPKIGSDTDGEGSDGLNRSGHPCSQPTVSLETSSQSPERLRERTESPERPRERTESTSPSSPNEDGDGVQTTNQRSEMSHQSPTGAADETSSETVPDPAPASGDARADLNEPETPTPPQVEPQSQSLGRVVALSSERAESATNSCERTAPPGDSTNSVTDFRGGPCVRQTRKRVSLVDADAGKLRARKRAKLGDGTTSTSASPPSPAAPMTVLELGHMVVLPGMRLEAGTLGEFQLSSSAWTHSLIRVK